MRVCELSRGGRRARGKEWGRKGGERMEEREIVRVCEIE